MSDTGPAGTACCARCRRALRPPAPRGTPRRRDPDGAVVAVRSWPEGPICSGCFATACETYGTCPCCGAHRLLPGRDTSGRPVCTDCAGGLGDFTCSRCGKEGWNHYRKVCGRCVLTDRLTDALTDDTGQVSPPLVPLLTYLAAMPRPRTGILWLTKPHTRRLLDELAHGRVPLTHHGMDQLSPPRAVAHLRHLLIAAGILAPVDATLNRTTAWAADYLADLTSEDERRVLQRYDRWVLHRHLEHTARTGPLLPGRDTNHRYQLRQAHEFLTWARARRGGLDGLAQADLDAWATTATSGQRTAVRAFLAWTARTGLSPQVEVPLPLHQ